MSAREISSETLEAIRFGFGRGQPAQAYQPPKFDDLAWFKDIRDFQKKNKKETLSGSKALKKQQVRIRDALTRRMQSEFARALAPQDDFKERLVWFWSDHFNVSYQRPETRMSRHAFQDEAIRPNVYGRFSDMLNAAVKHPAMLMYLDQYFSVGTGSKVAKAKKNRGLNENLAREVLELHTLGVDAGYTQKDVTQLAEIFAGLSVNRKDLRYQFRVNYVSPGEKTVLGTLYRRNKRAPEKTIDVLTEDLARHPKTAEHIARKLAVHFVSDTPPNSLIEDLKHAFQESGGDLARVSKVLRNHPAAQKHFGEKAKKPFEYIVSSLRALNTTPDALLALEPAQFMTHIIRPMTRMGQPFRKAPGPDGWPEDAAYWITPAQLTARITWAMGVVEIFGEDAQEPMMVVERSLGEAASKDLLWAVPKAETRTQAVGLILAAPEFQRR